MSHHGLWRRLALGLAVFGQGSAHAEPAHYVVFEIDPGHAAPRAVFYAAVDLAPDPDRDARPEGAKARQPYRSLLRGQPGKLRFAEQPRLRAEFAQLPGRPGSPFESFAVASTDTAFVVRVPLAEADAISFDLGAGKHAQIDLSTLARNAASLPLAGTPPAKQLTRATSIGPSANRLDILVLGDGYTDAEAGAFAQRSEQLFATMFGIAPHAEYANFVNWTTGFIASAQSGADHPPYLANCATDSMICCADSDAINDPRAGQFRDTALDARFCTFNIHRLLTVDHAKVFAAAAAFPNWDRIFVSVNDPTYGGSGGYIAVTSADSAGARVMTHEFGHSFAGLADEYETAYPGFPACSDLDGVPCEANVTDQTSAALIKWSPLLTPGIAIPTAPGTAGIGLFAGARYQTAGMYRPSHAMCLMRSDTNEFCPVCAAEFVLKLYAGGFGTPTAGIDLIEPGSESPPSAEPVNYTAGSTQIFAASVLRPSLGAVSQRWFLDGVPIPGADASSHAFSQASTTPSTRTLELRVHDDTALVPPALARDLLEHKRSWTIQVQAASAFQINQGITGSWFNPDTSGQGMLIDLALDPKLMFIAWFTYEQGQPPPALASVQTKVGSSDNRWLTASGTWAGNSANLTLYASAGGVFDSGTTVTTSPVGTLTISFNSCSSATASYSIPAEGLSGTIPLSRSAALGMGALCQSLMSPDAER